MNSVHLIGRLTRDPEVRYTEAQLAIARFSVAIDRGKDRNGESRGTDFPNVVVFGKQAENCERYLSKGRLVAVQGRIQTGSYVKNDGTKVYTTDVVADRVEFLEWGDRPAGTSSQEGSLSKADSGLPEGFGSFAETDEDDIPF